MPRSMKFQFIEFYLDNFTGQLRRFPVRREQGHLSALIIAVLKYMNGLAPRCVLTVIDFAEVEHLSLDNPVVGHPMVLHNAPVAMFFTVFESGFGSQKHVPIFRNQVEKTRG